MRDELVDWVGRQLGVEGRDATVDRIGTGHSRAMYRLHFADGTRCIVRVEQGGVFGTSGVEEGRVMRGLHDAGFAVARVLAEEPTGMVIGQPFFVMEFLEGAQPVDERAIDDPTAAAFVDALRQLHELDPSGIEFDLQPPTPSDATPMQIDRWRDIYRTAADAPIPLLEEAAAWLHHHAPPLQRLSVVHGDAGPGNFVHDGGGRLVALTDFEFTHLGDPAEDWSFCLAMRGSRTMPGERWLELFAERAGVVMSDDEWRYWEAFNLFKGACANRTCLDLFERGVNRAPNMAIIGTTLHQAFLRRLVDLVAS